MKYNYKCQFCGKGFYWTKAVSKHHREKHPEKLTHTCDICGEKFINGKSLFTHKVNQHKEKKKKKCPICGKFFIRLTEHLRRHKKKYKCRFCDKVFTSQSRLETHNNKVHFNRQYKCSICGETFCSRGGRHNHEKLHKLFYTCKYCGKVFNRKSTRDYHVQYVHEKTFNYVTCKICGKRMQERGLEKHINFVHNKSKRERLRNYKCPLCDKAYKQLSDLEKHLYGRHRMISDDVILLDNNVKHAEKDAKANEIFRFQCVKCGEWLHHSYKGPDGDLCAKCKKKYTKRRVTTQRG